MKNKIIKIKNAKKYLEISILDIIIAKIKEKPNKIKTKEYESAI